MKPDVVLGPDHVLNSTHSFYLSELVLDIKLIENYIKIFILIHRIKHMEKIRRAKFTMLGIDQLALVLMRIEGSVIAH